MKTTIEQYEEAMDDLKKTTNVTLRKVFDLGVELGRSQARRDLIISLNNEMLNYEDESTEQEVIQNAISNYKDLI